MTFQQIISDLVACGLTQTEIAAKCMTSQGYVWDLLSGRRTDPKHSLGVRLINLHRKQIRRKSKASA